MKLLLVNKFIEVAVMFDIISGLNNWWWRNHKEGSVHC